MAFPQIVYSCGIAVELMVLQPYGDTFGVDWETVCQGDVPEFANDTYWADLFNLEIEKANAPPEPPPAVLEKVRQILLDYVLFAVCLFGLIANLLTFIVLILSEKKSSTITFLLALSVIDWLLLAGKILIPGLFISGRTDPIEGVIVTVLVLTATTEVIEVWLIIVVTTERFVMIVSPLKARSFCTTGNARKAVVLVVVLCVLYRIPQYLYGVVWRDRAPKLYTTVYEIGFDGMLLYVLPLLLLFFMNIKLLHTVHEAKKRRQQITASQSAGSGSGVSLTMTCNIVAVVILFLVCQTLRFSFFLYYVDSVYWQTLFSPAAHMPMRYVIQPVAEVMLAINSAANFFIYFLFYPRFREGFVATFLPCLVKKPRANSYSNTQSHSLKSNANTTNTTTKVTSLALTDTK